MTTKELTGMTLDEKVFRKMGAEWEQSPDYYLPAEAYDDKAEYGWCWRINERLISDIHYCGSKTECTPLPLLLPPISSVWEVCAEFLVAFMRGNGYRYRITTLGTFVWEPIIKIKGDDCLAPIAEIKNDNIALAACEAFMEVEL